MGLCIMDRYIAHAFNCRFPETIRSFKYGYLLLFPWLCYSPSEDASYCLPCVLFGHDFLAKASRVKNLFSLSFRTWPSTVSYFRAHCEGKKKKNDPSHESVQSIHFLAWSKLEAIFLKSKAQVIKLICYLTENINIRFKKTLKY